MTRIFILFLLFSLSCSTHKPSVGHDRSPAGLNMMTEIFTDLKKVMKLSKPSRKTLSEQDHIMDVVEEIKYRWQKKFGDRSHTFFSALPRGPVRKWQNKIIEFSIETDSIEKELEPIFICTVWRHENLRRTLQKDVETYRRMIPKNIRFIEGGGDYVLQEGDKILGKSFIFRLQDLTEKDLKLIVDLFSNQETQAIKNAF